MLPLRTQGTPNLADAAERTGARIVLQGIAFAYVEDGTDRLRPEDDPLYEAAGPPPWDVAMPVVLANERRAVAAGGLVLRYGQFYGPGTHWAPGGETYESVSRRRFPIPGRGTGVFTFIHVEDAAAATVAALEAGAAGVLNVVDDTPMTLGEWLPRYAEAIGAPRPLRAPLALARLVTAPLPLHWATRMPGVSNGRARATLGWAPRYPSLLDGLRADAGREDRAAAVA